MPIKKISRKTSGKTSAPRHFLVVVDETPESLVALRFAGLSAAHTRGRVSLLMVLEPATFQHWMGVETIMKEEAMSDAQSVMRRLAGEIADYAGITPQIVIREGNKADELTAQIAEDDTLTALVLGIGADAAEPGPLVSEAGNLAARGLPVILVPGDLPEDKIHALA